MSEDFNGLLNALKRANDVNPPQQQNPWYVSPNTNAPVAAPYVVYAQPPPQQVLPVPAIKESGSWINYLIAFLLILIISLGIVAWMRMTKLETIPKLPEKIETSNNAEIRKNLKNDIRELPVPATLTHLYDVWPNDLQTDEIANAVTENLLEYVKPIQSKDVIENIDVNEVIVQDNVRPATKKKLVADESEEVLEYMKKRDNLFNN